MTKNIKDLTEKIDADFLPYVRRPSRYIGGEVNQVKKQLADCDLTVALCFPDVYEIGASHLGIPIIYSILNNLPNVAAERVFAPWLDGEQLMREKGIALFSLESKAAVKDFDVIGFSLTNELCYTNVLNMLDLAGLKVRSCERQESDPIIIAGGGMANCCEPIADFIDIFLIGEAEDAILQLVNKIIELKKSGCTKAVILERLAENFNWAYVPALYKFEYSDNKIKSFSAVRPQIHAELENAVVQDFENAPAVTKPIIPFIQAIHDRISIEIMRGCPGRCRFCQASYCRRPIRYRSISKILEIAKTAYEASGYENISLLSLSSADYQDIENLVNTLYEYFEPKHVGLSLPSLRVSQQLKLLPNLVTAVRKSGLTIAVESASEKIRQIIHKPLKNEDLFSACLEAYKSGYQKIKLYFMVGLPSETEDDIKQIVHLSYEIANLRKKVSGRKASVNVTVSWFVPKPHTPLQWLEQRPFSYFENAKNIIISEKKRLNARMLQFKFHNIERSILESSMSRADRRMGDVVEHAWKNGAKFDLWDETFNSQLWEDAYKNSGLDMFNDAQKGFYTSDILPWQHLGGPKKDYLLGHFEDAAKLTESENQEL